MMYLFIRRCMAVSAANLAKVRNLEMRRCIYAGMAFMMISSVMLFSCKTKPPAAQPVVATSKRILGVSPWSNPKETIN